MERIAIRLRNEQRRSGRRIGAVCCARSWSWRFVSSRRRARRRGRPRGEPALAPLARHVPRKDLLAYLEFDGLDAHADAWRASAAYKLLNDTKLGSVLEDLALQGIELIQETTPPEQRVTGAEVVGLLKHIARNGFAVGVSRKGPEHVRFVAVLRHGDRPEFKRLLEIAGAAGRHDGCRGKAG